MPTERQRWSLDTSAAAHRAAPLPDVGDAVAACCTGATLHCSTYVCAEFKRAFVWDAIIAHALLTAGNSVPEVLGRLVQIRMEQSLFRRWPWLRKRTLGRTLAHSVQILASLLREAADGRGASRRQVEARLRRFIEYKAVDDLLRGVSSLTDETGCGLARAAPELRDGVYDLKITCTAKDRVCRLPDMLRKSARELDSVVTALRALRDRKELPPGLTRALEALEKVSADPERARGRRCLWLGDVIIAIECPGSHKILTLNMADFEPIARAIGKCAEHPQTVADRGGE